MKVKFILILAILLINSMSAMAQLPAEFSMRGGVPIQNKCIA